MKKKINVKVMEKIPHEDVKEIINHLEKLKKFDIFVDAQFEINTN